MKPASPAEADTIPFASLGLPDPILRAVKAIGYEAASRLAQDMLASGKTEVEVQAEVER